MTPVAAVAEFMSGLPSTIQNETLAFVTVYALDIDVLSADMSGNFPAIIQRELDARTGLRLFGLVLRLVAAIDFVLERQVTTSRRNADTLARLAEHGPEALRPIARASFLRHPLADRHLTAAADSWRILRATSLSPHSLQAFEESPPAGQ